MQTCRGVFGLILIPGLARVAVVGALSVTSLAHTINERFTFVDQTEKEDQTAFARDVRIGLTASPKHLPCRYLYDHAGSLLFERICDLPEYYVTRTEREILRERAGEIRDLLFDRTTLVELGSGNSAKTRVLIEAILSDRETLHYVPVDVSREMLRTTSVALLKAFDGLEITAVAGDYRKGLCFAENTLDEPKCFLWLGSSIGNFDRVAARDFLRLIADTMTESDRLLLGIDLRKSRDLLERAYDDSQGVTAQFNKNLLVRINRELDGDFDLESFDHRVHYDEEAGRVEMHLVSKVEQTVRIDRLALNVPFTRNESIHTGDSYKYSLDEIDELARSADLRPQRRWLDAQRRFSLNLFARADASNL